MSIGPESAARRVILRHLRRTKGRNTSGLSELELRNVSMLARNRFRFPLLVFHGGWQSFPVDAIFRADQGPRPDFSADCKEDRLGQGVDRYA